jgi:hypothetical protein
LKLFILILFALSYACSKTHSPNKLEFSEPWQKGFRNEKPAGEMIVYYHPGDCSFCYSTLKAISDEFTGIPLLSISSSGNKILVEYYLELIHFNGVSLIDSTSLFLTNNQDRLLKENLFLIDSQHNILASGQSPDETTFKLIRLALHKFH